MNIQKLVKPGNSVIFVPLKTGVPCESILNVIRESWQESPPPGVVILNCRSKGEEIHEASIVVDRLTAIAIDEFAVNPWDFNLDLDREGNIEEEAIIAVKTVTSSMKDGYHLIIVVHHEKADEIIKSVGVEYEENTLSYRFLDFFNYRFFLN